MSISIPDHCVAEFFRFPSTSELVTKLDGLISSTTTHVTIYGYAQSGKSALVKRAMIDQVCGKEAPLRHGWLNLSGKTSDPYDVPTEYQAIASSFYCVNVVGERDNAYEPVGSYYENIELLDELIRELRPGEETEQELLELKADSKGKRYSFLVEALYADQRQGLRPILLLQGGAINRRFQEYVFEIMREAHQKGHQRYGSSRRLVHPLVICEFWFGTDRAEYSASAPRIPSGKPPVKKPGPQPGMSQSTSSETQATSYYGGRESITVWGLQKDEATKLIKHALSEVLSASSTGGAESLYDVLSERVYAYCGGHLGLIVLAIMAIDNQAQATPGLRSSLNSTDPAELDETIDRCITRSTFDLSIEGVVNHIWRSTGMTSADIMPGSSLAGWLREAGLTVEGQGSAPALTKLLLMHVAKGDRDMEIDPVTLSMLAPSIATLIAWVTPGAQAFSTRAGEIFADFLGDRIVQSYQAKVMNKDAATPSLLPIEQRQEVARAELTSVNAMQAQALFDKTRRATVVLLGDHKLFSETDLQSYWNKYGDDRIDFSHLWAKGGQLGAAKALVDESVRRTVFQHLLAEMEITRPAK